MPGTQATRRSGSRCSGWPGRLVARGENLLAGERAAGVKDKADVIERKNGDLPSGVAGGAESVVRRRGVGLDDGTGAEVLDGVERATIAEAHRASLSDGGEFGGAIGHEHMIAQLSVVWDA